MKAFILGNGPSINNVDTELLRGRFSIATNAIHKLYDRTSWRPQVLVIGDVTREHRAWVNEIVNLKADWFVDERSMRFLEIVTKNQGSQMWLRGDYKAWARSLVPWRQFEYFDICTHHNMGRNDWSKRPLMWHYPQICRWGGSTLMAIQLAVQWEYNPIYLLGCDLDFKPGNGNHFCDDYGDSIDEHQAWALNKVMHYAHELAFAQAQARGVEIYNATPGGALEAYPRVTLEEVL